MKEVDRSVQKLRETYLSARDIMQNWERLPQDETQHVWTCRAFLKAFSRMGDMWNICGDVMGQVSQMTSSIRDAEAKLPGLISQTPSIVNGLDPVRIYFHKTSVTYPSLLVLS